MRPRIAKLVDEIRKLAADGLTIEEAAKSLDYTYQVIARHARENQIRFRRPSNSWGEHRERNQEICRRYLDGAEQASLAREFGITRERVRQIIEKAGIVSESKRHADFVMVVVGTVARKGLTVGEAAEMFNISRQSVYNYCRDNGIKPATRTAEEMQELDNLAKSVVKGASIRQAAGCDHRKAEKLRRHLQKRGIKAKGRSRHDDFSVRKRLITNWRGLGHSWAECAQLLSKHDGRPISLGGLYLWAKRHMPELFASEAAA